MSNGKVMIIRLIVGLKKKDLVWFYLIKMSKYYPKPYEPFDRDITVTVNLSNYATKTDLKNVTHVHTSRFA